MNTPEHLSIGFKTAFGVQYDGPDILWDNRVAAQLQRQEFSAQDQATTVQEAADDLVLSSELRFNSVRVDLGEHDIPMVPYVQASYDTEFTAIEKVDHEVLETGHAVQYEFEVGDPVRGKLTYLLSKGPLRSPAGEVLGLIEGGEFEESAQ